MRGLAPAPSGSWLRRVAIASAMSCAAAACTLDNRGSGGGSSEGGAGGAGTTATTGAQGGSDDPGNGPVQLDGWIAGEPSADGTYALPPWLLLQSPSAQKTSQIGPHAIRTGFGVDAARARNVGGGWGLSLESERTNRALHARITDAGWTRVRLATIAPAEGPDGTLGAATVADENGAEFSAVISSLAPGPEGAPVTLSAWVAGVPDGAAALLGSSRIAPDSKEVREAEWAKVSLTGIETESATALLRIYPVYGDPAATGSARFDFVGFEEGKYPSSSIVTDGGEAVTRRAESLRIPGGRWKGVVPDGRFHAVLAFAPNYAPDEQGADHNLLFFDASHRVYLSASSHAIVVVAGDAAPIASEPITWSRDETVTLEVISASSGLVVIVSTKAGAIMASADAIEAFPGAVDIRVLGGADGSEECADLKSIAFYSVN